MFSCLVIHESKTPDGGILYRDQIIEKTSLSIGRSASNDIHLPDHAIRRNHASISQANDGSIYLVQMSCVEHAHDQAGDGSLQLQPGVEFMLGTYLFKVLAPQDAHHLVLSVAHQPAPASPTDQNRKDWLANLDKRKNSYMLLAVIAFLFLLLPLLPSFSAALDRWQQEWSVPLNQSWSAGQVSRGHSIYASKCSMCHEHPFRAVNNQVCRDCHKEVSAHFSSAESEQQGKIKVECTQCHQEHRTEDGLILHDSALCTNCHANLAKAGFHSDLANSRNFEHDHPAFNIELPSAQSGMHGKRIALGDKTNLKDQTTLKFSHEIHLAEKGVSSPRGDTVMACKDCHHLDASGEHFSPVSMVKDCQQSGCHKLYYEEPLGGRVPHGSSAEVMHNIKSFFLTDVANPQNFRARGCAKLPGSASEKLAACVNKATQEYLSRTLFKAEQGCNECHHTRTGDAANGDWKIEPVNIVHDWFTDSKFPHLKHRALNCDACHDKRKSKRSEDISMPDIQVCRTCHTSDVPRANKIANRCDSCHKFHTKAHPGK